MAKLCKNCGMMTVPSLHVCNPVAVRDPKPAPRKKLSKPAEALKENAFRLSKPAPKKRIPAHVRKQAATLAEMGRAARENAKKRTGRVVARRMWTCGENCTLQKETAKYFAGFKKVEPVFVLPADAASVERMVEQVHAAITREFTSPKGPPGLGDYAHAALAAIGIKAKGGKR